MSDQEADSLIQGSNPIPLAYFILQVWERIASKVQDLEETLAGLSTPPPYAIEDETEAEIDLELQQYIEEINLEVEMLRPHAQQMFHSYAEVINDEVDSAELRFILMNEMSWIDAEFLYMTEYVQDLAERGQGAAPYLHPSLTDEAVNVTLDFYGQARANIAMLWAGMPYQTVRPLVVSEPAMGHLIVGMEDLEFAMELDERLDAPPREPERSTAVVREILDIGIPFPTSDGLGEEGMVLLRGTPLGHHSL